jgi:2-C-methyl-D-erythritol 2,4-cyclodiphosphate synthase
MVNGMLTPRIGTGFDAHRLAEGRELWLGGVKIPYEKGLLGHSDADAPLHALTDALLGAAAMGVSASCSRTAIRPIKAFLPSCYWRKCANA